MDFPILNLTLRELGLGWAVVGLGTWGSSLSIAKLRLRSFSGSPWLSVLCFNFKRWTTLQLFWVKLQRLTSHLNLRWFLGSPCLANNLPSPALHSTLGAQCQHGEESIDKEFDPGVICLHYKIFPAPWPSLFYPITKHLNAHCADCVRGAVHVNT